MILVCSKMRWRGSVKVSVKGRQRGVKWRLECVDGQLAGNREHLVALKGNGKTIKDDGEPSKNTLFSQKKLNNLIPINMTNEIK